MSLLSWNCRGLGNPRTVRDLCQLVEEKKPRFLFLMETRIQQNRMQVVRNKLGFAGMLVVDPIGTSGGLALIWKEATEVEIQNFSLRHISPLLLYQSQQYHGNSLGFTDTQIGPVVKTLGNCLLISNISHHNLGYV
jgi:hypothetical protein